MCEEKKVVVALKCKDDVCTIVEGVVLKGRISENKKNVNYIVLVPGGLAFATRYKTENGHTEWLYARAVVRCSLCDVIAKAQWNIDWLPEMEEISKELRVMVKNIQSDVEANIVASALLSTGEYLKVA